MSFRTMLGIGMVMGFTARDGDQTDTRNDYGRLARGPALKIVLSLIEATRGVYDVRQAVPGPARKISYYINGLIYYFENIFILYFIII